MIKSADLITGEKVIRGIAKQNRELIQWIYGTYFPRVESFVKRNSGNSEEARDLFQECMFLLFQYSRKENRKEIENFDNYFYGMYRNRWMIYLSKRKRRIEIEEQTKESTEDDEDLKYLIYLQAFEKLNKDCREVLKHYLKGITTEELAKVLMTSIDYAKRKKYLCKEKLKTIASKELKKYE